MGADWILPFKILIASHASGSNCTHLNFFPQYILEWHSDMSKSLDEVPVMAPKSAECVNLGEGLWYREFLHRTNVFLAGVDPLMGNMMRKVYDL